MAVTYCIKRIVALSVVDDLAILETKKKSENYLSFRKNPLSVDEDLFVVDYLSKKITIEELLSKTDILLFL